MVDRVFAVDGNFYLHRIFHTSKDSVSETIASRFLSLICKDALAVKANRMLVAFDGNRVFRYKLFPDYKAGRKKDPESTGADIIDTEGPYVHMPATLSLIAECGIPNIQHSLYEADDVLASVASQYDDVVLGTKDKDAVQTLRDGVVMYDSTFKKNGAPAPRYIRATDAVRVLGVEQDKCLDLQTLIGDGIDNVPQLMTRAAAIRGLNKYGSIKVWMQEDVAFRKLMSKRKYELILNRKLVRMKTDIELEVPPIKWNHSNQLPTAYVRYRDFCNPKSKGLFARKGA